MNTFLKKHNDSEMAWGFIKVAFLFFWGSNMLIMLSDLTPVCFLPVGVCKLFCISNLFTPTGKLLLSGIVVVSSIFYLFENRMFVVTFVQFLLSSIIISHHESNGMFHHATIFSPIFAVQALAYWQYQRNKAFNIAHYRVQYSIQMIAAGYTLAGISKIAASGIHWINSENFFSLQVIKNYSFVYFATGSKEALSQGYRIAHYLQIHPHLITFFLGISLFLELFCFLALLSKTTRIAFGIGLILMHTGILWVMDIPFGVIAPIMIIFFLNPLFVLYQIVRKFLSLFNRTNDTVGTA